MARAVFCLVLLFYCLLPAVSSGQTIINEAVEVRLSNGLKVILLENNKAPMVSFQVWYRAGARGERVGKTGLAHLLEHMMFKGTQKVSGEDFTRIVSESGGEENAFTSHDFAGYFETLNAEHIGVSIALESDRMSNLVLRESDFMTERMVVIEERRMRVDDNPRTALTEQLDAAAYQSQPYHRPVVGWMDDIGRITLDDVRSFYADYYNPGNAFIVVVGDFRKDALIPELEKAFGSIPSPPVPERYSIKDPPQQGERRIRVERPSQLGLLSAGYHVPNLSEPDAYVLEVIRAILSGGKSSRFYDRLVRKGLVLEAAAEYLLVSQDPGLFYTTVAYLPDKDAAEVEKALHAEMELLKSVPVESRELEKAKNQLEAEFVFDQDALFSLGLFLASYEIASSWRDVGKYIPSIRRVTPEDIQRVAARYFVPGNRTVGVLVPSGPAEEAPPPPPAGMKMIR
ncbi:MAG: pitrilysin family protein [Syntrophobacter sp.]